MLLELHVSLRRCAQTRSLCLFLAWLGLVLRSLLVCFLVCNLSIVFLTWNEKLRSANKTQICDSWPAQHQRKQNNMKANCAASAQHRMLIVDREKHTSKHLTNKKVANAARLSCFIATLRANPFTVCVAWLGLVLRNLLSCFCVRWCWAGQLSNIVVWFALRIFQLKSNKKTIDNLQTKQTRSFSYSKSGWRWPAGKSPATCAQRRNEIWKPSNICNLLMCKMFRCVFFTLHNKHSMLGRCCAVCFHVFVVCAGVGLVSYQIFLFHSHFAFFHLQLEKLLRMYKQKKTFVFV